MRTTWIALALFSFACSDDSTPRMMTNAAPRPPRAPDAVAQENALAGDPGWQLANPSDIHGIEGYGRRITLAAGEPLDVAVNVDQARAVSWSLYRIGWYGGAGGRKLASGGPVRV